MHQRFMVRQLFGNKQGYATLMTVVVLSAVGLVIVTTVSLVFFSTSRVVRSVDAQVQSRQLAHGCAELGLMELRNNDGYTGSSSSTINNETCFFEVNNVGGNNREVIASSTVQGSVYRVEVQVTNLIPLLTISSWEEV